MSTPSGHAHAPVTVTLTDLELTAGPRTLVAGLDLTAGPGDVVAVVGPNGSGKSTLLRAIAAAAEQPVPQIRFAPAGASVGWLPQEVPDPELSLLEYARLRTGVAAADAELAGASDALAAEQPGSGDRYAIALDRWLALGAADLANRLPEVAARVGLVSGSVQDGDRLERPMGSLSGGQAARACLVALLLSRHDVALLDEPTNNLDPAGQELVAEFVRGHQGPVLIASHDRAFLDAVASRVVELDLPQRRVGHYAGGWSEYAEAKALRREHEWEAYREYADTRDRLAGQARQRAEFAAKGHRAVKRGDEPDKHLRERDRARADRQLGKASRARAAADRLPEVDQPRKEWQLRYSLAAGAPSADVVATLSGAVIRRGDFRLGPVDLALDRGDRVAVLGENGSGKTTLLEALLGRLPLEAGRQTLGSRVRMLWIDQRRALLETERTLLEVITEESGRSGTVEDDAEVRTLLAKFGLGADHVLRPAASLSLGERTRALMALGQDRAVNLLVLDEPTNHLDVAAIEQLEEAIADYDGTLVVVSHDRRMLEQIRITRTWRVTAGAGASVSVDAESDLAGLRR